MINVKITDISVCHGKKIVDNEVYIKHFNQRGKDIKHFLEDIIGRNKRYMFDNEGENTLTLSLEAIQDVLSKTGLKGSDFDMIVVSSQLPEYVAPPTSIKIHNEIKGKDECICYDINVNCAGMSVCYEQLSKYMALSPAVKRILVVGCDYINMSLDPEEELFYGHYGDAACAVILEKTEDDCGLIDSMYITNSIDINYGVFPGCGFSNLFKVKDTNQLKLKCIPPISEIPEAAVKIISTVLERNSMTVKDIKMFCLSQYTIMNINKIRSVLGIDESQSLYIGDEYGYTGTSSPFIVLYESIKKELIKRGDYVFLWTVGAGTENIGVLFKY